MAYEIQSVNSEMPMPADAWRTIGRTETPEQAYDIYLVEFHRLRSEGTRGRVQVLLNGKPVSLVPTPKKRR